MTTRFLFPILAFFFMINSGFSQQPIIKEINRNWGFKKTGDTSWLPAEVPGTVHTDLLKNNIIKDPFYGDNEKELQWIEKEEWEYRTSFNLETALLKKDNISIKFEGLDTYATIFLNDTLILIANNMFREWEIACKNLLKKEGNILVIKFKSPAKYDKEQASTLPYQLPDERAFSRKAPYQYGWDWGPRFVTSGIWRPVHLIGWNKARIKNIHLRQGVITDNLAKITAIIEIESNSTYKGTIDLHISDYDKTFRKEEASFSMGMNTVRVDFDVKNPRLWWTNGLGEPFLYNVNCNLTINNNLVDTHATRIGVRSIELVQEKDSIGSSFYFKLNGKPVFMKGANYIPQDSFLPEVTKERYSILLKNVVDANMNMLRVWGGGIYEHDIFYDLCDENGILVWQDFMFACTMYPGDPDFIDNVRQEAIDNIKRLRNHPCIALWCGNNEVNEGWHNWEWQKSIGYSKEDSAEIWGNYLEIFENLLPNIVRSYSPYSHYIPSSPAIGWGHPESLRKGDSHYWGVWWGEEPFEIYEEKVGRFMSEYGFQAFPDIKTINSFSMPDDRGLYSKVMLSHQKHPTGNELIETYLRRNYNYPKNFEAFIYVSQLVQAYGIKKALEAHRRAMPYCMGTLYWQLNDCWPVVSWSSLDYFQRWKALHYFSKKAFKEILVSAEVDDGQVSVYIISDKQDLVKGKLILQRMDFNGKTHWETSTDIDIQGNRSEVFTKFDIKDLLKGTDKGSALLRMMVFEKENLLSENLFYFTTPKELKLEKPTISIDVAKIDDGYELKLSTDKLAKNLYLSTDDDDGFFSDNYFDLLPEDIKTIYYLSDKIIQDFQQKIKILTLVDIW